MTTAIITGAAGGIGAAFAEELAKRGHRLLLIDVAEAELRTLADRLASDYAVEAEPVTADLTDRADIERVRQRIVDAGDVEVLVNNAGFGWAGTFADTGLKKQIDMVDVMIVSTVSFCHAALPQLIERGCGAIINVSSVGGFKPGGDWSVYGAAKRFVMHFAQALSQEVEGTQIAVQALCPGYTRTGFHDASQASEAKEYVPAQMWMTPTDVAVASLAALRPGRVVVIPSLMHHLHLAATYSATFRRYLYGVLRRLPG